MKKFLFYLAALIFTTACNNSSTSTENTESDTTHAMPAAEIAPVPDVPEGARVYFKNLTDGETVSSPFKVEMGVDNMSVDTATGVIKAGSGHHHLLINSGDSLAIGTIVPKDSTHLHFGNAQTETELNLPPGHYQLTLQFADGLHRSYGGKLANSVHVTVK